MRGITLSPAEEEFAKSLRQHIQYVIEAGTGLGVDLCQLKVHDYSKWERPEFSAYANRFHGNGTQEEFAKAWLHHIHVSPHHWQHWILPNEYTVMGQRPTVIEMPEKYALEMVADWMGASRAYTGTFSIYGWLAENIPLIRVHRKTAKFLRATLCELGYADVLRVRRFPEEE